MADTFSIGKETVFQKRKWVTDYFQSIVESSTDHGCVLTDSEGYILTWNKGAEKMTGFPEGDMLGKPIATVTSQEAATSFKWTEQFSAAEKEGDAQSRTWWNRADGGRILVKQNLKPLKGSDGELAGYAVTFDDYSSFHQYQTRLKAFLRELTDIKYAIDVSSALSVTNTDSKIIHVNDAFCRISGYSREELIGRHHRIVNSGYHPPEFFALLYETIIRGDVWSGEIRNRAKDGSLFWVDVTIVPFLDPAGKPYQYVAIHKDITSRKEMEEALRASEQYLDSILNTIGDPVFVKDEHHRFVSLNNAVCALTGLSRREMLGKTGEELCPHTEEFPLGLLWQADQKLLETGQESTVELPVVDSQGRRRAMETTKTRYVDDQGQRFVVGVMHDITELKETQQSLRLERDYVDRLIQKTPAIYVGLTPEGLVNFVNPAAETMTGYSPNELIGRNWWELFYPGDLYKQVLRLYEDLKGGKEVIDYEMTLQARNGEMRVVCWNSMNRYDDSGGLIEIIGFGRDITLQKKAEQELRQLNEELEQRVLVKTEELRTANASLQDTNKDLSRALHELKNNERLREIFVSTLTHDLRTPLAGEKRAIELLSSLKEDLPEDMAILIEHMGRANEELLNMVNKLLEIYKLEAGRISLLLEPVDIRQLVSRCIDEVSALALRKNIKIGNLIPDGFPHIWADAFQLKRVFTNLLGNAVENISGDSIIRVEAYRASGQVELRFSDNGPGIPPEVMAQLFDRYSAHRESRQKVSSGLGLYICKMIMELHGGKIEVRSKMGQGTCFILRLPERIETA